MNRQIPPQRLSTFALAAEASKGKKVLIACRSEAVRTQYERAIPALGGKLENVIFRILANQKTPS